jgi:hypothetical protein
MTYDDWKLETPEDEAARKARRPYADRLREECPHCYARFDGVICDSCGYDIQDDEHDPDDAREEARDRD